MTVFDDTLQGLKYVGLCLGIEWFYCLLELPFDLFSELYLPVSGYLELGLLLLSLLLLLPLLFSLLLLLFLFELLLQWWLVVAAGYWNWADLVGVDVRIALILLVICRETGGMVFAGIGRRMVRLVELLRMRLEALKLLRLGLLGRFVLHDRVHRLHHRVMRMVHLHRDRERVRTRRWHLVGVLELLTGMHIRRVLRIENGRKMTDWRHVHVRVVKLWLRLG